MPERIWNQKFTEFPLWTFEYHSHIGKVYIVIQKQGTCVAEHVSSQGQAYGFMQTYLRGVRRGLAEAAGNRDLLQASPQPKITESTI